jgi:hypothetical protein
MKACSECRHYYWNEGSGCDHPKLRKDDPIDGKVSAWPREERKRGGRCGEKAKYWEAKPPRLGLLQRLFA